MNIEGINIIDGGAGLEIEPDAKSINFADLAKGQDFDPEKAEKERLKAQLQEKLDEGNEKEEILKEYKRPIDELVSGRRPLEGEDPLSGACRARLNLDIAKMRETPGGETHYLRIMGFFANGDMANTGAVDFNAYKSFVNKYETVADFEKPSERFIDGLRNVRDEKGNGNSKEKIDKYLSDMEKFKECLFGKKQVEAWDLLKGMEAQEKAVEEATEPWDEEEIDSAPEVVNKKKEYFESLPLYSEVIIDGYKYIISSQGYKTMEELEEAHSIENAKRGMMGMFGQSFKKAPDGLYYMVTKKTYN